MSTQTRTQTSPARGLESDLVQLEAWAQEELCAQTALEAALRSQEQAIRAGSTADLLAASEAVRAATQRNALREKRRVAGLRALARRFGVAPETLTLASIAERVEVAGLDASRLRRTRAELRDVAASALRRGRRVASLARQHRSLVDELFRTLAGERPDEGPGSSEDALVVDRRA